jgi:hypothetical protein
MPTKKKKKSSKQQKTFYKSIFYNYIFYTTLLLCLYKFTLCKSNKSSYLQLIVSFIFAGLVGYLVHYISHQVNFTKICKRNKHDNLFMRNPYIYKMFLSFAEFGDFHSKTHHDSSINKKWDNIFWEFANNLFTQGWFIVLIIKLIDIKVLLLWSILYSSAHQINYSIFPPSTHRDHHTDPLTNYGGDILDIAFNTKYDMNDIEIHNHTAINLIIITYLICYFCD